MTPFISIKFEKLKFSETEKTFLVVANAIPDRRSVDCPSLLGLLPIK